jgi:hypothetical protein
VKRTAGVIGFLVVIVVVVLTIVLLHGWQQNYAATHTDSFDARETITIHFLDTDRYVEFENAQVVYSGHDRILVTEDNQRIQIVNAEIIYGES